MTPQKRPKVTKVGGLSRLAMNTFGVSAAIICPAVMEKNYYQKCILWKYLVDQDHCKLVTGSIGVKIEPRGKIKADKVLKSEI